MNIKKKAPWENFRDDGLGRKGGSPSCAKTYQNASPKNSKGSGGERLFGKNLKMVGTQP